MNEQLFNTIKISIVFCVVLITIRESIFFLSEILHRVNLK